MPKYPKVSFVLPALNEEKGIGLCLDKINKVIKDLNLDAEVIVVDNGSEDKTAQIALEKGAKVVREEEKGYGSAYLRGFKETTGEWIVMGDADATYDFLETPKFLEKLDQGYDLVIGSRFKGKLLPGSMPVLNRVGNWALSSMLRLLFKTSLSDIHCGMRAFTKEALAKMRLRTKGMELASEMVISAIREKLKIAEVPIVYHPRRGNSKLSKLRDGWRHIKFMLLYAPYWLYFFPGLFLLFLSLVIEVILSTGPVEAFGRTWDIHLMIASSFSTILGIQIMILGTIAKVYGVKRGLLVKDVALERFMKWFSLEKGLLIGAIFFLIGLAMVLKIVLEWALRGFKDLSEERLMLLGSNLVIIGIEIIFSSFLFTLIKES